MPAVITKADMEKRRSQLEQERLNYLQKKYKETQNFYWITLMDKEFGNVDYLPSDWGNEPNN